MTDRHDEPEGDVKGYDGERPDGEDIHLPEEREEDGETVEADTASGGAPEPA
ncbi:hypothetical protein [Agromyces sp. LHK192]|uniref:hypothetical protein n=1 Tax=Agromyces sp. LHK192 TaxID=2498704 RepID=UPI0013E3A443|nr:hypothetical protein [Agromyces sp. LHK192]